MRQQDAIMRQLAQTVTDFIEPVIPYLVIGSKKAAEEAGKKAGSEIWEIKKKLWGKLCSRESPELKEAAGDMVIAPSDPEVKQVLIQEILNSFEKDPCLAKEISSILKDERIQRMKAEENSVKIATQISSDKTSVFEEFNELLEKLTVKNSTVSTVQESEQFESRKGKEAIIEKALDFACQIQYGDVRSHALSLIVPYLEGPKKGEYIKKTLYSASNIQDEEERARVLSPLALHLKGPGKEELIEDIFDFAPHIQYGDAKFQILSSLIPHLEGTRNEVLMEKALEMAAGIQSVFLRVQSFSLLVPHLKGQRKEEIIEEALELASSLKDKDVRPQALLSVVPLLDEARKKEILKKALEIASGIQSEYRRAQALSSINPYIEGSTGLV